MFEFHFLVVTQNSLFLPISIPIGLLSAIHKKQPLSYSYELSVRNLVIR
jgi:hypothetical protein